MEFKVVQGACALGDVGNVDKSSLYIEGAVINKTNIDGQTPLMVACINVRPKVAKALLQNIDRRNETYMLMYLRINQADQSGKTALHFAPKRQQKTRSTNASGYFGVSLTRNKD